LRAKGLYESPEGSGTTVNFERRFPFESGRIIGVGESTPDRGVLNWANRLKNCARR